MNTLYIVQFVSGSTEHPLSLHVIAPSGDSARILAQAHRIQNGSPDYQAETVVRESDAALLSKVFPYLAAAPQVIKLDEFFQGPPLKAFRVELWNSITGSHFVTSMTQHATDAKAALRLAAHDHILRVGQDPVLISESNRQAHYRYFAKPGEKFKNDQREAQLYVSIPR